jgi:siroheme synthase (precorrin-2 oxidase/ferrochelatase)
MRQGYPILLDLSRRPVVIIGGGAVASRKAAGVLAAGAQDVRAVAPKFVRDFPEDVRQIAEMPWSLKRTSAVFWSGAPMRMKTIRPIS